VSPSTVIKVSKQIEE